MSVALRTAVVLLLLAAAGPAQGPSRTRRSTRDLALLQEQHARLHEKFAQSLEELAKRCEEKKQPEEAKRVRDVAGGVDAQTLHFAPLPTRVRPQIPGDVSSEDRYLETQLRNQQQDYARSLYLLSRNALHSGYYSYAYDLVRETAFHDPDHASARKVLGYERLGDEWLSPFEADKKRKKQVWHPQFGWLAERDVPRYEAGERLYSQNRWISAAKDAELRRDFNNGWKIETEHFRVQTNHSLERGAHLAGRLEEFYGTCRQSLAGFFLNPEQLRQLFEGKSDSRLALTKKLDVNYYRSREEYLAALSRLTNQKVEITKGMYFPNLERAFFFFDPNEANDSTLFHEATHLLLAGSRKQSNLVGQYANFWLVEGIACYMESFRSDGKTISLGDPTNERIRSAQFHLLQEDYYVPLREFAAMGMQAFQTHKEIRKNYSQAAALTHFFLHYDGGKYRDALIEQLSQIYSPVVKTREHPQLLSELIGVAEEELDREYVAYLKNLNTRPPLPKPEANAPAP